MSALFTILTVLVLIASILLHLSFSFRTERVADLQATSQQVTRLSEFVRLLTSSRRSHGVSLYSSSSYLSLHHSQQEAARA